MNKDADTDLADDLIWGIAAIAKFVGLEPRQVYYLASRGRIPVRKLSHRIIVASKAQLRAAMQGGNDA